MSYENALNVRISLLSTSMNTQRPVWIENSVATGKEFEWMLTYSKLPQAKLKNIWIRANNSTNAYFVCYPFLCDYYVLCIYCLHKLNQIHKFLAINIFLQFKRISENNNVLKINSDEWIQSIRQKETLHCSQLIYFLFKKMMQKKNKIK